MLKRIRVFSSLLLVFAGSPFGIEDDQGTITTAVHPGYEIVKFLPNMLRPQVTGLDFMSDGTLIVTTAYPNGTPVGPQLQASSVYAVTNHHLNNPDSTQFKQIIPAFMTEIMGVVVVDDEIYVSDKYGLVKLTGLDAEGVYQTKDTITLYPSSVGNDVSPTERTYSFHEFPFGLLYKDGFFYIATSSPIQNGGEPYPDQPTVGRGALIKISKETGEQTIVAGGFRTPAGMGWGPDSTMWVNDNEGGWNPTNMIYHVTPGHTYGYPNAPGTFAMRNGEEVDLSTLPPTPAAVHGEEHVITESIGNMVMMPQGIFKGQLFFGDMSQGGMRRIFVEKVNGGYQGAIFSFSGGFMVGIFRNAIGPDGILYAGGIGNGDTWNWGWNGKKYGLEKVIPKAGADTTFEILAVRSRATGMELEFTKAVGAAMNVPAMYAVKQWWYHPTQHYGGPERHPDSNYNASWTNANVDTESGGLNQTNMTQRLNIPIQSVTVSPDGKKVFLELPAMRGPRAYTDLITGQPAMASMVTHIQLNPDFKSAANDSPWFYNTWYSINSISESQPFDINGCTDEADAKYNPLATFDDGTCSNSMGVVRQVGMSNWNLTRSGSVLEVMFNMPGPHKVEIYTIGGKNAVAARTGSGSRTYSFRLKHSTLYLVRMSTGGKTFAKKVPIY